MLGKAPPTTSSLDLVNSEVPDSAAPPDAHDCIKMADLVESLDTRELDMGEGEEIDSDGSYLGVTSLLIYPQEQADITINKANSPE